MGDIVAGDSFPNTGIGVGGKPTEVAGDETFTVSWRVSELLRLLMRKEGLTESRRSPTFFFVLLRMNLTIAMQIHTPLDRRWHAFGKTPPLPALLQTHGAAASSKRE